MDNPTVAARDEFEPALGLGLSRVAPLQDRIEAVTAARWELIEQKLVQGDSVV